NFRNSETARNMGFNLKDDVESYSFKNFVKELFFDSETNMVVISGVPTREIQRTPDGKVAEGAQRNPPFAILPSWLMGEKKREINDMAGSQRALCQGNLAPNHYGDKASNSIDKAAMLEQMERELQLYKIDSWKWYCHTDPARTGNGFRLDDDNAMWFYEESRKRGMKLVSVHKGYSYQSRTLGHLANPQDVEKAALANPDFNFVIYHSAIKHGPNEPNYLDSNKFDPKTGDFEWHSILMDIKKRNPGMSNVYPEVGSFFNALVVTDPVLCMHGRGKNIKHYGADHVVWGTDCLWWGSPQWAIEAFKRFDISDEFVEKFGYSKISKQDKAKILGLNAAKLYNVDVNAKRNAIPGDKLEKAKLAYLDAGGARQNAAYRWVRANDCVPMRLLPALVLLATAAAANAQAPAPVAHFHHVHLNATDPAAAILFYTSKFKARKESFAGLGDAVWTGDSWLLFTKVSSPPPSDILSGIWHIGWGAEVMQ